MNPSHAPFYVNFNLLFATNNIQTLIEYRIESDNDRVAIYSYSHYSNSTTKLISQ